MNTATLNIGISRLGQVSINRKRFVSGHRFSDAVTEAESVAPSGAAVSR